MDASLRDDLRGRLEELRAAGLYKGEHVIESPQSAHVRVTDRGEVLNLCANNYLGLADHPAVIAAAHAALDQYGYGMASVRFICGTHDIHRQLEARLSVFLGTEDTILYSSCFDANGGLFETLLGEEDAVISDALNHASIIDGIRLCKARKYRYANCDLADLEAKLREAAAARTRLIVTESVFAWPGMGKLLIGAIQTLDRPVIVAHLIIIVLLFVVINLVVDILYTVLDPRVRIGGQPA